LRHHGKQWRLERGNSGLNVRLGFRREASEKEVRIEPMLVSVPL